MTGSAPATSLACVTGRFQPVHADHLRLFRLALAASGRLVVAVTNPDPGTLRAEPASSHRHLGEANPFTYFERLELLTAALGSDEGAGSEMAERVRIVPLDLGRPEHWPHYVPLSAVQYVGVYGPWEREKVRRLAAGGYRVVEIPGDRRSRRTSTAIREALRAGKGWEPLVPATTVEPLRELLARRQAAGLAR
jgi:nicotinamide mononucleotide adenylyltransferase